MSANNLADRLLYLSPGHLLLSYINHIMAGLFCELLEREVGHDAWIGCLFSVSSFSPCWLGTVRFCRYWNIKTKDLSLIWFTCSGLGRGPSWRGEEKGVG